MIRKNDLPIRCGKATDSLERLKALCEAEAGKLLQEVEVPFRSEVSIPFWTADTQDLICECRFHKDETGAIHYRLDFSNTTL